MVEDRAFPSPVEGDVKPVSIRVALVGGARLNRAALRHLVQSDAGLQIVADTQSAHEILTPSDTGRADVVLLDIDDSSIDPHNLLEQTKSCGSGAAILILTEVVEDDVTDPLLLAGARGVVSKNVAASHLLTAIRKVNQGELWVDRATASRLISSFANRLHVVSQSERMRIDSLSPRELEVVAFVADGLSNKAIAKKMGISDNTVRHHLTSVYSKLETRDRIELLIYAFQQGVVRHIG